MEQKVHHGRLILERIKISGEKIITKHETFRNATDDSSLTLVLYVISETGNF